MPKQVKRGFVATDLAEFSGKALPLLHRAQEELVFLLNHGYNIEKSVTFIGNHYQLSARQRFALTRATASWETVRLRLAKRWEGSLKGHTLLVDAFNLIITLEAALSGSTLLYGMDGTVRDLCGLHGTYRLIDKTDEALRMLAAFLKRSGVAETIFYLDAPVSNSGRLKARILTVMEEEELPAKARLVQNADAALWEQEGVVTSDAIILDRCRSWVNLGYAVLQEYLPEFGYVDLCGCLGPEPEGKGQPSPSIKFTV